MRWTEEQEQFFKRHYNKDLTAQQIGDRLGRSMESVHGHAQYTGFCNKYASMEPKTDLLPEIVGYLAGFFDGEGCIAVEASKYCRVRIYIGNLNPEPLLLFAEIWDAAPPRYSERNMKNPNWRGFWELWIGGRKAHSILVTLLPYLRVKRSEAELAIQLCRRLSARPAGSLGNGQLPKRETETRQALVREIKTHRQKTHYPKGLVG